MIICTRKFRTKHVLQVFVVLFLLYMLSVWWISSKCFNSPLQDNKQGEWEQIIDNIRTKIEQERRTKIETISNNSIEDEMHPRDIRHVPPSIRIKRMEDLRLRYKDDRKHVKELKEKIQVNKIDKNTENLSTDIDENETYPLDIRYMPAFIQKKQEKSLGQEYDDQKYLKELKEMLHKNEITQDIKFEDDFLRTFITSNGNKIDQAFSKVENFLNLRIDHSYFFQNLTFDFTQNPAYKFVTILPHRRKDGSITVLVEIAKWDPNKVPVLHLKQIMFMIYVQAIRNPVTQASGISLICDFANVKFQYVKYSKPQNLYLLHHVSFEVMPAKYVGFHLVNINAVANILITVIRPFLPKSIENIFYIHSSVKELHDFFPTSMLPVQYGGQLEEYYTADWIRKANQQHGNFPPRGQKNTF